MSDQDAMVQAVKLITGALVDRLPPAKRQEVIDDLHAALATVRDDELAPPGTVEILREVIDYLQAGEDLNDARFRRPGG